MKGRTSFQNYNDFLKWNELIEQVNQLSPKAQAFHTTRAWDVMITEVVAVSGIKWGLIVSAIVALGSILVFTGNIVVSVLAIVSVLGNIAVMLGCFWIFGWSLGVVEALSITILVGLSVVSNSLQVRSRAWFAHNCLQDYCIHVAETYNSKWSESRSNKLRHALTNMGFSVLSGALTTMGAVFILLFCTVQSTYQVVPSRGCLGSDLTIVLFSFRYLRCYYRSQQLLERSVHVVFLLCDALTLGSSPSPRIFLRDLVLSRVQKAKGTSTRN